MIKEMRLKYPAPMLCEVLGMSKSGYYAWQSRGPSKRAQEEVRLEIEIKAAHARTRQSYGPERLQKELKDHGITVGVSRIKRIRKKLAIRCRQKRKFKATTDSRHNMPVAENLLGQDFQVPGPNRVWVSDITYIPTDEGWLYLVGHKDLFGKELVGYAFGDRITKDLVEKSLIRAVAAKRPPKGLIHHADRGSLYSSSAHQAGRTDAWLRTRDRILFCANKSTASSSSTISASQEISQGVP